MGEEKKRNGWKTAFWIVFTLLMLSWLGVIYVTSVGLNEIDKKDRCNDICLGNDSFSYGDDVCKCYQGKEVTYTQYMS